MTEKASKTERETPREIEEKSRRQQLREDGRRPLAVNLTEGLELSEFLSTFPRGGGDLSDMEAREMFRRAQKDSVSGD